MILFIAISSPLVLIVAFFATAFIRTNVFSSFKKRSNYKREKLLALFSSYLCWLLFFLFVSNSFLQALGVNLGVDTNSISSKDWGLNLIPFKTILTYHRHVSGFSYISNIWGNVILTIPLGFFLPLLWKRFQAFLPTLIYSFFFFCLVETIQFFIGRSGDIDDILLNLLGIAIGYRMALRGRRIFVAKIYQR